MTDSPEWDKLQFLSQSVIIANHSFIRWHGRNARHRYNYLYSKEELKLWVDKVKQISLETPVVKDYFNNHYGAKAVINALQFKEILGNSLSEIEKQSLNHAQEYYRQKDHSSVPGQVTPDDMTNS
jgi:uncharacterized protein YecE (DUF72 family)